DGYSERKFQLEKDGVNSNTHPPVTAAEIQDCWKQERRSRISYGMDITTGNMRRFHGMDDAKEI
ncbi:hypothetical protein Tco_1024404, partial [Tanacetum coccineum]